MLVQIRRNVAPYYILVLTIFQSVELRKKQTKYLYSLYFIILAETKPLIFQYTTRRNKHLIGSFYINLKNIKNVTWNLSADWSASCKVMVFCILNWQWLILCNVFLLLRLGWSCHHIFSAVLLSQSTVTSLRAAKPNVPFGGWYRVRRLVCDRPFAPLIRICSSPRAPNVFVHCWAE